jgi:tRNA A37 threonylcarbamoyladenosine dehydratase
MTDFQRRFGGIARLYGQQALDKFRSSHVCVIGVGGVGSWAVEGLARSGIGQLTLIDMDHVAESNINRQLQATNDNLGKSKIIALQERIARINPDCRVKLIDDFLTTDNIANLLAEQPDYTIDCIDNYRVKAALIAWCRRNKRSLVTTGGAGGKQDPTRIHLSDLYRTEQDPLLAKTRSLLRRDYNFPKNLKKKFGIDCVWSEEPPVFPTSDGAASCSKDEASNSSGLNCGGFGSCMPVTASFGQFAVARVLQRLAKSC